MGSAADPSAVQIRTLVRVLLVVGGEPCADGVTMRQALQPSAESPASIPCLFRQSNDVLEGPMRQRRPTTINLNQLAAAVGCLL
jgi:hypothetical protein